MIYAKYKDKLCPKCGSSMCLREVDEKPEGEGYQDEYYECKSCGCEKKVKVRYGQIVSIKEVAKYLH